MHPAYIYDDVPRCVPQFTGKERDTETGLDYFGARYYASNMGRWLSPDWSATPASVPYARFSDPQSLNLYSYVRNRPLSLTDIDGHRSETDWKCENGGYCTKAEISDAVVNTQKQTITYSQTTYEATQNSNTGEWAVTKTTLTTTFSTSENNTGGYVTGSSQTTTGTSSNLNAGIAWNSSGKPQAMSESAAQRALGNYFMSYNQRESAAKSAPSLGTTVKRDYQANPKKYWLAGAELGIAFVPVAGEVEAYKLSFELHWGVIELLHSLNEK